jgi:hypothetical protein
MRRLLCLAMVLGSCTRTGLPKGAPDAGADVAAIADAKGTGGATGTGGTERTDVGGSGGCVGTPISEDVAAASFRDYMLTTNPNYNPDTTFGAEEISIPGLWDGLQAQLFTGTVTLTGETRPECSFLYRACRVEPVNGAYIWFGPILSGAVRDGALYYSWASGSGIYRSTLGKVVPVAGTWQRTKSIDYFNPSSGPPGVVVARDGNELLVYRAYVPWGRVNEWQNPERMGRLADFGDRLAIVDESGQEIPSVLP